MKKIFFLVGMGVLNSNVLLAQESKLIKVKAEDDIQKVIPITEKYRFPTFRDGTVVFIGGSVSNGQLNYNLLLGEMQFINPSKDTLSLANEYLIKWIKIGKDQFFYDPKNGYLEVIEDYQSTKLAIKQIFRVAGIEKMAAYQQSSGTSSIKNYTVFSNGNGSVQKLEAKGDVVFAREKFYFFIDQNNRYYKANKTGLLKIYTKHKKTIENYLQETSLNFNDEDNLKKILQFCSTLP